MEDEIQYRRIIKAEKVFKPWFIECHGENIHSTSVLYEVRDQEDYRQNNKEHFMIYDVKSSPVIKLFGTYF